MLDAKGWCTGCSLALGVLAASLQLLRVEFLLFSVSPTRMVKGWGQSCCGGLCHLVWGWLHDFLLQSHGTPVGYGLWPRIPSRGVASGPWFLLTFPLSLRLHTLLPLMQAPGALCNSAAGGARPRGGGEGPAGIPMPGASLSGLSLRIIPQMCSFPGFRTVGWTLWGLAAVCSWLEPGEGVAELLASQLGIKLGTLIHLEWVHGICAGQG